MSAKPKNVSKKANVGSSSATTGRSVHPSAFWRTHWLAGVLLIILPFVLYYQSTQFGYVLDDKIVLSENKFVQKGSKGIKEIFATESFTGYLGKQQNLVVGARYRPLSIATFALEHQLFGVKPHISHTLNILLYALTGLLIYRLVFLLLPPGKENPWFWSIPFLTALIFILHPIHTEVVANIKGRDEILALLLALAATYTAVKYLEASKPSYLIATPILFLLALLAKENALTFLAIVPMAMYLFTKASKQQLTIVAGSLLASAFVFILIRTAVIGYLLDSGQQVTDLMNNPFVDASTAQKYATITMTIGWYLKLLFVPHPLTHDYYPYHVPIVGWTDYRVLISLALTVALLGLAAWRWQKTKEVAFSILYFFITLSMVSNLVFPVGTFMNERFLYMPSLGFCLLLGYILIQKLPEWLSPSLGKSIAYGLLGIMGLGFALRTITRVPDWEKAASLEASSIHVSSNSARSNQYYAYSLYEKSLEEKDPKQQKALYDEAWPYVNKSLEIYPAYSDAHTCRAGIAAGYFQQDGDIGKLLGIFDQTLRVKPVEFVDQYLEYLVKRGQHITELTDFFHRIGFGHFWTAKKDADRARKYLEMGLKMAPGDAQLNGDLAAVR